MSGGSATARRAPIVIGLGNAYAHDDGVGHAVVAALTGEAPERVSILELDGEPARVIEAWDASPLAIVVDAACSGGTPPGTVFRLEDAELGGDAPALPRAGQRSSSHALGVADAVELGRVLGRLPARLVVFAVEGNEFGPGPGLSGPVTAAVPGVVSAIIGELTAPGARRIEVTGVVQGVGFRPFVWRLAHRHGISGWVRNHDGAVEVHAEGPFAALEAFCAELATEAPPLARVHRIRDTPVGPRGLVSFTVAPSAGVETCGGVRHLPPDSAPCVACRIELADPDDRRFRHPFVNCTDCGPRFTIIEGLPYDRSRTSMAAFDLCARCADEYDDPSDRRFHAEPLACPDCGPQLRLVDRDGADLAPGVNPIDRAASLLRAGGILALKGVGGYQLACDATDVAAVAELRRRKHRPDKPLAVMVSGLDEADHLARLTAAEDELLASPAAPIVLVGSRDQLPAEVAPGHRRLGLMLPASPLHDLLSRAVARPLVLTSGNRSEEPIAIDDADALDRMADIADAWLTHDRRITARHDDSVSVVRRGGPVLLRRARGHAPSPLPLGGPLRRSVLAVGADLGNTFCLAAGTDAFVSAHVGDLDDDATITAWRGAVARHLHLVGVRPEIVAHDAHPDLHSTRLAECLAEELGIGRFVVRHHHAHVAAVMAEHGLVGPVLGVAFDGFGLGDDGTAWGGEFLVADAGDSRRVGHLAVVPQPGGDLAVRYPVRMALAHAEAAGCLPGALDLLGLDAATPADVLGAVRADQLLAVRASTPGAPTTSSIGRLFDAVAALCGLARSPSYEGQPAMLLEQTALTAPGCTAPLARFRIGDPADGGAGPIVVDPAPVVCAAVIDLTDGRPVAEVAAGFHAALADAVTEVTCSLAGREGLTDVCLAGGVWANSLLVELVVPALTERGLAVHLAHAVPPGDGGLCLGQALVAGSVGSGVS
ncbi:MAG: carbamoyltransferase HypF [Acidimicrobiia bacterium]